VGANKYCCRSRSGQREKQRAGREDNRQPNLTSLLMRKFRRTDIKCTTATHAKLKAVVGLPRTLRLIIDSGALTW
jgi:hypothetical protein